MTEGKVCECHRVLQIVSLRCFISEAEKGTRMTGGAAMLDIMGE